MNAFDVIGVVGNRRRAPRQPGWAYVERRTDGELRWDDPANLSGAIAHGAMPFGPVVNFGPGGGCELLDGVLLAGRRSRLADAGALFDPIFRFHLGTWPLGITHQSGGTFGGPEWERMYATYIEKWGD